MQVKYKDDKKSHMVLIEKIPMPNCLTVEVWDRSLSIAADTTKVALLIRIRIELQPSYFAKPDHYERVRKIMGTEIFFEYEKERAFVRDREKNVVFQELLDDFKKNSLPYLSRPSFPARFALSKYWDVEKNSYKYSFFLGNNSSRPAVGKRPAIAETLFEEKAQLHGFVISCNFN